MKILKITISIVLTVVLAVAGLNLLKKENKKT